MPKAKQKPLVEPKAAEAAQVEVAAEAAPKEKRPVLYPTLQITERSIHSPHGPLTVGYCVAALGWETEKEFQERMVKEEPGTKAENWTYGDNFHCRNVAGEKVRCSRNAHNRYFDQGWCDHLVQTILNGQWAGPHTVSDVTEEIYGGKEAFKLPTGGTVNPGDTFQMVSGTVNGETIRISRYGDVLSGQHTMTAVKLANEKLHQVRSQIGMDAVNKKYPAWKDHNDVFVETITIKGLSEDPRVLMSVDYVKPRSAADVFYTSEVFRKETSLSKRRELCKMLEVACSTLWQRTDARGYRTHPEMVGFLERHPKLLNCVTHLFEENTASESEGRKISKLRLSAGQCAALMYLMGSAGPKTDGDAYRNEDPAPSERNLDWSYWVQAGDFWTELASGIMLAAVRKALAQLVDSAPGKDENEGLGGRANEKLAILAKAWEVYKDHPETAGSPFPSEKRPDGTTYYSCLEDGGELCLSYTNLDDKGDKLPEGQIKLIDVADFDGIDSPEAAKAGTVTSVTQPPDPPPPTKEEIEKSKEEINRRKAAAQAKIDEAKAKAKADRS